MSEKVMSFAERIKARQEAAKAQATEAAPAPSPTPAIAEQPVKKFGQPKPLPEEEPKEPPYAPDYTARNSKRFGSTPKPLPNFEAEPEPKKEEEAPLGKVIQSFNVVTANKEAEETKDELSGSEAPAIVAQLKQKIHDLAKLEGADLRFEVGLLREMITANGDATRYLGEEDLGLFVRSLRRMTDNRIARDMATAKTSRAANKNSSEKLTADDIANALEML